MSTTPEKPAKKKKMTKTQLMEEHKCALHRAVIAYSLLADVPLEKDKYPRPRLASAGYYLMVNCGRVESANEILDRFHSEVEKFLADHKEEE